MSESKEHPHQITDLVNQGTKRDECVSAVKQLLNPDEIEKLGGDDAADKVVESMAYLGVFAPAPATFDKNAFLFTAGADLSEEEAEAVWETCRRIGVLQHEPSVGEDRYSVSKELVAMLENPENKYLTED